MLGVMMALALQAAPDPPCIMSTATLEATLKFADYPARAWSGPAATPRQDTRFARLFRTVLKKGAIAGPNFAGHMTIVEFGCGTSCVHWGLVDAKTGQVFQPDAAPLTLMHVGDDALKYRRDSRLLLFAGAPQEDEAREGVYAYIWTDKGLKRIGFVPYAKACIPDASP